MSWDDVLFKSRKPEYKIYKLGKKQRKLYFLVFVYYLESREPITVMGSWDSLFLLSTNC